MLLSLGTPEYALEHLAVTHDRDQPGTLGFRVGQHPHPDGIARTGADRRWTILELNIEAGADNALVQLNLNGATALNDIFPHQPGASGPAVLWLGGLEGREAWMRGMIAEVLLFDAPPPPAERAAIGGYLAARHGIPSRYPAPKQ